MFKFFRQFVQQTLAPLGLELRRKRIEPAIYHRRGATLLRFARERGVTVLCDIGANRGQYAAALREVGFAGRIVSFEPVTQSFAALQPRAARDGRWDAHQLALGNADSFQPIQVGGDPECSSLLPMSERHVRAYPASAICGEEQVNVRTLDSLREQLLQPSDRVFLKLDVQGYELKVLEGAPRTLPQVELIDIELSLVPLYEGQPLFREVLQFLADQGFSPVSFENGFTEPVSGHALQVDAIFIRDVTARS